MYISVAGFLMGIMVLQFSKTLPLLTWVILAGVVWLSLAWIFLKRVPWLFCFVLCAILGCGYVVFTAQRVLSWSLPNAWEGKTVTITGVIASLPRVQIDQANFEFNLQTLDGQVQLTRLRLSWFHYPANVSLTMGSHWQFQVRLKKPHGLANPGGFDYEKWLFARRIRATGYIISGVSQPTSNKFSLHDINGKFRQYLQQKIQQTLAGEATSGLITALIMGAQSGITEKQWQVMQATGTNHLMAIAGVHIGFVAGFIYCLVNFLWRRSTRCLLWMPAPLAAAFGSLAAAMLYSALAGFALPTQRALLMLTLFMLGLFLRRQLSVWNAFALAVLVVLIVDPLATLTVSFWLSFGAVFVILYGISGRVHPGGLWWKYARVQWVITLGLIPISLVLFQQTSLIAFLANTLAVPAVGILVLPLCLSGALILLIWPFAGHWLLVAAAKIIAVIWWLLAKLAQSPGAIWQQSIANPWILATTIIAMLLLLAPKGLPVRWLGVLWLLPLLYYRAPVPAAGEVWLTLLDVGQGLSAVIRTAHHTLVFDAGPKMGLQDDAGARVIVPFLHSLGIKRLDMLMISHGDSDHIGGAFSVLAQMPVSQIITSVPERFTPKSAQVCRQGQTWRWDQVVFRVLYPPPELLHQDNNSSCVLAISQNNQQTVLLTGDIEESAEYYLLQRSQDALSTKILVVPHHGSSTSSTTDFVNAVHPQYALFPVGYKNRYHFPSPMVLARYQRILAILLDTASGGAITLRLNKNAEVAQVLIKRQQARKIW
ncbi:MAG TPA: DNA internalization-related competence protein ComEC/Rec2 [Gammaproteobacteria bacterium]|nr:DNA internalization-related competence protein ComEC/Rec2 [Gammaproteobacteria bacterium]